MRMAGADTPVGANRPVVRFLFTAKEATQMADKHREPVARGQRIIHEVVFVPDPALKARVRFVHKPDEALPPGAVGAFDVIDVVELAPGAQVGGAREEEMDEEEVEEE